MATRGRELPPLESLSDEQIAADTAKYGPQTGDKAESPRKPRARSVAAPKTTGAPSMAEIEETIQGLYTFIGATLSSGIAGPRGTIVGNAVAENAEKCAAAYADAARRDPKFAKFLTKAMSTGAYGGLIFAHMPIAMSVYFAMSAKLEPVSTDDEPAPQPPVFGTGPF